MKNKILKSQSSNEITSRAERYLKENVELLKRHKLITRLVVNFAPKTRTPILSRIALWIVAKQGGQLDMQFGEVRKQ
jgi:hypothetical protein